MPLDYGHSKAAFQHNVSTETNAGKAQGMSPEKASKRAVAIGYAIQRQRKKNRK